MFSVFPGPPASACFLNFSSPQLFEYSSEYVSPAMSPAPGSSYGGSAPASPGPSGLRQAADASPNFNVQVEQVLQVSLLIIDYNLSSM